MDTIVNYRIIKSETQYRDYCDRLKVLLEDNVEKNEDEIELISMLVEKWDEERYKVPDLDPIRVIKELMKDHGIKASELADVLSLSKGTVSKILSYQKGLSKETIRKLSEKFKLTQETFNQPYNLRIKISVEKRIGKQKEHALK